MNGITSPPATASHMKLYPSLTSLIVSCAMLSAATAANTPAGESPEQWRAEHRIIDLHQHINCTTQHLARAVKIMDAVGRWARREPERRHGDAPAGRRASEFERNKAAGGHALFPAVSCTTCTSITGAGTSRTSPSAPPSRSRKATGSAPRASRNSSGSASTCATARASSSKSTIPKLDPSGSAAAN